eukprot:UN26664
MIQRSVNCLRSVERINHVQTRYIRMRTWRKRKLGKLFVDVNIQNAVRHDQESIEKRDELNIDINASRNIFEGEEEENLNENDISGESHERNGDISRGILNQKNEPLLENEDDEVGPEDEELYTT